MKSFDTFNLVPGLTCNLSCAHCANASAPTERGILSQEEVDNIVAALNRLQPRTVLLTGGEPTLYLGVINAILQRLTYRPEIILTTNGTYATTLAGAKAKLDRLHFLDLVQLSFDSFHDSTLESPVPAVLKEYCSNRGLEFVLTVSMTSVADLAFACDVEKKFGVRVIVQKIDASGRAKATGAEFQYATFDPVVLDKRCPSATTLSYIQGKGFTVCCSNVVYNLPGDHFAERELDALERSAFHHEVRQMTFRERMAKHHISTEGLAPRFSSACNLCENIVQRACVLAVAE